VEQSATVIAPGLEQRAPGISFFAVDQRDTVIAPGIVFTAPRS